MSDASETPDAASLAARLAERECELIDLRQRVQRYAEDLAWAESQGFLTELVRGLAHELNNPLAVILGHAQRMGYRLDDRDDCRRRLQLSCNEVDSCIGLVERLRRYA
ncbi:MAG: histidine kinase dimerization/phospho-acceptor domain-containing protein, partial [Planctomycetota bacterium]